MKKIRHSVTAVFDMHFPCVNACIIISTFVLLDEELTGIAGNIWRKGGGGGGGGYGEGEVNRNLIS